MLLLSPRVASLYLFIYLFMNAYTSVCMYVYVRMHICVYECMMYLCIVRGAKSEAAAVAAAVVAEDKRSHLSAHILHTLYHIYAYY